MSQGRIEGEKFLAQCRICGAWREVQAEAHKADLYFEFWRATFRCCKLNQISWFILEKVDDDIH